MVQVAECIAYTHTGSVSTKQNALYLRCSIIEQASAKDAAYFETVLFLFSYVSFDVSELLCVAVRSLKVNFNTYVLNAYIKRFFRSILSLSISLPFCFVHISFGLYDKTRHDYCAHVSLLVLFTRSLKSHVYFAAPQSISFCHSSTLFSFGQLFLCVTASFFFPFVVFFFFLFLLPLPSSPLSRYCLCYN